MAGIMHLAEALHDRRFWATHYADPDLFEVSWSEVDAYACMLCGCEGHPEWLGDEEVAEELSEELAGSRLDIPCPDGSALVLSFTTVGTFFSLQPPDSDQLVLVGSQEGHDILSCYLPVKSPWLNPIEPQWVHGKRAIVQPGRLLSALEASGLPRQQTGAERHGPRQP